VLDQALLERFDLAAAWLRYYWFRLNDAMLPVGAALALVGLIASWRASRPRLADWATAAAVGLAGVSLAMDNLEHRADLRPGADRQSLPTWDDNARATRDAFEEWRRVCGWIADNTASDARFLTPRAQQTFKWYAERSEVCSWKDVPQDAVALVAWWQRQDEIYPRAVLAAGLAAHGEERLLELAEKYGAQYILVDRYLRPRRLLLPRVYPDRFSDREAFYEVYQVPVRSRQRSGMTGDLGAAEK
jgi:hypothetical protein